jgi:hypothetical protein
MFIRNMLYDAHVILIPELYTLPTYWGWDYFEAV